MTIVSISDTHGRHAQLDMSQYPGDVLIHAGDWTRGRDLALEETKEFLHWFSAQPYKYKICIAGNHEQQVEAHPDFSAVVSKFNCTYLNNDYIEIEGLKFYGSPYSNEFCNWAFMGDEVKLSKIWALIPEDVDILITHGPAYMCNDKVNNAFNRDPNVGSKSLTNRKAMLPNLKIHISGHIHESYGIVKKGNVINVCASILNEEYQITNQPITVEV